MSAAAITSDAVGEEDALASHTLPSGELADEELAEALAKECKVTDDEHDGLRQGNVFNATIAQIAPFLKRPKQAGAPDGCAVCLEWPGGCARDKLGRPIVALIGMPHGTAEEQQMQVAYAMKRAEAQCQPDKPKCWTSVVEVQPRSGCAVTFRFPMAPERSVMDMQKVHFPASLDGETHFCGLPQAVVWAFKLCRPFMHPKAYNSLKLRPNFKHLKEIIDDDSLLKEWGGKLEFDFDEYIAWRAREEGDEELAANVGAVVPRRFTGKPPRGVTLASLREGDVEITKQGSIHKRGSGGGLFGTLRWKRKYVVVLDGSLWYFNEEKDDAESAREAMLLEKATITKMDPKAKHSRDFAFEVAIDGTDKPLVLAADSEEDRDAWIAAIEANSSSSVEKKSAADAPAPAE